MFAEADGRPPPPTQAHALLESLAGTVQARGGQMLRQALCSLAGCPALTPLLPQDHRHREHKTKPLLGTTPVSQVGINTEEELSLRRSRNADIFLVSCAPALP